MNSLVLLRDAELFSPDPQGIGDIMVAGGRILAMGSKLELRVDERADVVELDCSGLRAMPGLIDGHVHVAGAGGEGGPATRTPEVSLSQLLIGGITTVIGCLGTDGYTRSPLSVLMKTKSLREQGISAWMLTGAYQMPPPTVTGDIGRDIAIIAEIIGVGEIAVSDHRASSFSTEALIDVASKARVGGMLGGKSGIVQLHMGDAQDPLRPIHEVVKRCLIPIEQFMPTHMNRNRWIFQDAIGFGKKGGRIDLTASSYPYFPDDEIKPSKAVRDLLDAGVALDRITLSSDGNGSLPSFDEKGNLTRLEIGQPQSIFNEVVDMVESQELAIPTALSVVTRNPAQAFGLREKGNLEPGYDADILVADQEWKIVHLLANGTFLVRGGTAVKGAFEA